MVVLKIQNIYGDFLRSFKTFVDKVTHGTINKIEWNYGSKTLEYKRMYEDESFEYPTALVEIQDIQPLNGVSYMNRTSGMRIMNSVHQILVAENNTKEQKIIMDKRWINVMFTVTINTEDVTSLLNYHDLFLNFMPTNFLFYDYAYWGSLEVTDFVRDWDFDNDDITNVFVQLDPTYRYPSGDHYNEAPDPAFQTEERDRVAAKDPYPVLEGERYFGKVRYEPILKLNSITKQTDKENTQHSLTLNFEAQIELPNVLLKVQEFTIESIEIVIDTVTPWNQVQPILIDIPDNFLTNKNIQREIGLFSDAFVFPDLSLDPNAEPYLEIKIDINLADVTPSLWAVEDVTETSSKRFFIPLEHARIERIENNGVFESLRFYFREMDWFKDFNFNSGFNYFRLLTFKE
jgi:hypothetical protein